MPLWGAVGEARIKERNILKTDLAKAKELIRRMKVKLQTYNKVCPYEGDTEIKKLIAEAEEVLI